MTDTGRIELAHGGGGQLTCELIEQVILPAIGGQQPDNLLDAAVFETAGKVAFTTDTFVVRPLEFPGGDIGKLAICGTVNDLAVAGAKPRALSLALVLREGLE
ncbi:MAG: AIR synthase related protein, partial [Planctomycetota bacterium]